MTVMKISQFILTKMGKRLAQLIYKIHLNKLQMYLYVGRKWKKYNYLFIYLFILVIRWREAADLLSNLVSPRNPSAEWLQQLMVK